MADYPPDTWWEFRNTTSVHYLVRKREPWFPASAPLGKCQLQVLCLPSHMHRLRAPRCRGEKFSVSCSWSSAWYRNARHYMKSTATNHVPKWSNFFPAFSNAWTISGPVVSRWIQAFAWFSNWLGQNHPCFSDNSRSHDTMRREGNTTRTEIQWEDRHKWNQEFHKTESWMVYYILPTYPWPWWPYQWPCGLDL